MSLIGSNPTLKGNIAWKGEKGDSAYQVAIENGFVGTEQDWLGTLGTSSHFNEESIIHISTAGQTSFNLPSSYTSNSFIDVYVNGLRLNSNEYTINTSTKKIILVGVTLTAGQAVEIVVLTMSTNSLPIAETISEESTNATAAGTKAVHDYVKSELDRLGVNELNSEMSTLNNEVTTLNNNVTTLDNKITNNVNTINDTIEQLSNNVDAEKFNKSNIVTLTGSIQNIASGETKSASMSYPSGFNKSNTLIISKMVSSGNNYYDVTDVTMTTNGYPTITLMSLTDTAINIGMKNTHNTSAFTGHYKITIMRND